MDKDLETMNEERRCELYESIGRTDPGDPNYKYQSDNLKTLSDIDNSARKIENERLNNNARNDLDRQRIEVEMYKAETERMKVKAGVFADLMDTAKAAGFCWIAYHGEQVSYAIRSIVSVAQGYLKARRR